MAQVDRSTTRTLTVTSRQPHGGVMRVAELRDFVHALDAEQVENGAMVEVIQHSAGPLVGLRVHLVVVDTEPAEPAKTHQEPPADAEGVGPA
ncbi:hypothetical protein [Nonomuraea recticatena]|uniref:hypothetical protein n=1 Tax=Nonomuraea recticatena TaxID=46178 RepID=UPI0031F9E924